MLGVENKGVEDILLEQGIITVLQYKEAINQQISTKKPIIDVIQDMGIVTNKDLLFTKAKMLNVDYLDLEGYTFEDADIPKKINEKMARNYCCLPLSRNGNQLSVAMKDPKDLFALDDLVMATKCEIKPIMCDEEQINQLIDEVFKVNIVKPEVTQKLLSIEEMETLDKQAIQKLYGDNNVSASPIFKSRLGEILVTCRMISDEQLDEALGVQNQTEERIGTILVKNNYITQEVLNSCLEAQLNISYIDLDSIEIDEATANVIKESLARRHGVIPIKVEKDTVHVAMTDPSDVFALDDLRLCTAKEIIPFLAKEDAIFEKINLLYKKPVKVEKVAPPSIGIEEKPVVPEQKIEVNKEVNFDEEFRKLNEEIAVEINVAQQEEDLSDLTDVTNAPIVKMVNMILQKAVTERASDIHIEPYEDFVVVRYRIDGKLIEVMKHNKKIQPALVARIKIISSLNIAEKRIPQDGRVSLSINKKNYDMRVSILPTLFGEKVVIRIADKESFSISKKQLGLFDDDLQKFDEIMSNPHGIVLVTGPTGSGKSTTLYTALKELSNSTVNIMTVEDPVECTIKGINQVQVNNKAGLTFGTALRAFLRQDPDIIMVGEIRDAETAEIATRAAITGHLVLSTLHTNDAASSITRIVDMGIEPFIISSSIVGVIAQRLVRRLCPECKKEHELDQTEKDLLKINDKENVTVYKACGCSACNETGYKGRIAIYEIMNITRQHRELIAKNVSPGELKDFAVSMGMNTLRDSCARVVKNGTTSIDEMLRVTYSKY